MLAGTSSPAAPYRGPGRPPCPEEVIIVATRVCVATAALLMLLAACSSGDAAPAAPAAPEASAASAAPAAGPPSAGVGATLLATVGTEGDPEAFEIALTTRDGDDVTTLAAGEYTIDVTDYSTIHNFALSGSGVDEATSVSKVEKTTWTVTVEPGRYSFVCDPHPSMNGGFAVTA